MQRLRSQQPLGEATTGADGEFRLIYSRPGNEPIDIVVRAFGDGAPVAEAVLRDAGPDERVELTLPPGNESEYERLVAHVEPLLDGAALTELSEDGEHRDFTYLGRATGHDPLQVAYLALAHRHAAATGLAAVLFYGLLRQGLPVDLSTLAKRPAKELRGALATAADTGVIGAVDNSRVAEFAARLRALEVAAVVDPPEGAMVTPLAEIFIRAVPDVAVRERIYNAYLDLDGGPARFWMRLRHDELAARYADRLRLALHLGALTGNNAPLVGLLLDQFDNGELKRTQDLVRFDPAAWRELVERSGGVPQTTRAMLGAADPSGESAGRYAELVAALVAEAFPSAHVVHRLVSDPAYADSPAARFLAAHPDFDLLATPVNRITVPELPEAAHPVEQALDPAAARDELAGIQRVMKLAPRFEAMQALREAGFTSAYAVASVGRDTFTRRVADVLGERQAAAVHARATRIHAAAVNLVADLRTAGQLDVPWLPAVTPLTDQIPDWQDLFDSPDYCACTECRSIYSEAAYLVDLLYFLFRLGGSTTTGTFQQGPVADVLYARRDDLRDIELSCDNTNLPLPYVDLVNELLESAVAPATAVPTTQRQTSGDPAQLRIQPQHVNPRAYDALRRAVYPWDLPFDLWGTQAHTYLADLGVRRDELMATLHPASGYEEVLATERLGLSSVQRQIITGEPLNPPRTLAEFYGRPASTPPDVLVEELSKVATMLHTAGMRYAELVEVLDTRFVNPDGAMQITQDNPNVSL